jgi:hypothetical protein
MDRFPIEDIDALKEALGRFEEVVSVYLFGSASRGEAEKLSDIDIAVLLSLKISTERLLDLIGAIDGALATETGFCILNDLQLPVQYRVIRDGKLLYSANEKARISFESRVIDEYLDLKPRIEQYIENWMDDC